MAVAKLGAIVTGIAGSIGGTTFRRGRAVLVMQNKSRGRSRSSTLTNPALTKFSTSISAWSKLPAGTRSLWAVAAQQFQFPDKFGTLKYLTPRQLFLKLNADLTYFGVPPRSPAGLDPTSAGVVVSSAELFLVEGNELIVKFIGTATANWRARIQFQKVPNFLASPVFNNRRAFYMPYPATIAFPNFEFTFNPSDEGLGYPVQLGDMFNVFLTPINLSGFQAVTQVFQLTVENP